MKPGAIAFTLLSLVGSLCTLRVQAQEPSAAAVFDPAKTSIAVLFAPNFSDDKWVEQKGKESIVARKSVYTLFEKRGFAQVTEEAVDVATKANTIDLNKEESWTKANFARIGQQAGANLAAFVLIKQTRQKVVSNPLASQYVGEAEIEVWLVDTATGKALIGDLAARGRATGGVRSAGSRRNSAVEDAVKRAFSAFLKPYPETKK